jgi:stress-induced morphogen
MARFSEEIEGRIREALKPTHFEVVDESRMHSRRTAENPETHFKLVVVSDQFRGLSKVKRQQLVYSHLKDLFEQGLHAISQSTFTPEEWSENPTIMASPHCANKAK